ncbi:MAG: dihydropteroate synthase [Jatrophihabitans sp.]
MLTLGSRTFAPGEFAIMAIVNRTPDSFYDRGATFAFDQALDRVHAVVEQGAHIVDIGGVKAAPGQDVSAAEEIDRTGAFVRAVREAHPDLIISVDTWRHEVGDVVCAEGADLLNDAWGGHDPLLAEVAARHDVGIVCTHVGGVSPRTRPHRIAYDDVMADVLSRTLGLVERAVSAGVDRRRVLIDPAHDFGKNTYHSLEVTRRLGELVDTGWPVLVSLSNKDFVGETLGGLPPPDRLTGTLAATAICAWLGAVVYRVHNVVETKQTLEMVATIRGDRPPARAVRGLA